MGDRGETRPDDEIRAEIVSVEAELRQELGDEGQQAIDSFMHGDVSEVIRLLREKLSSANESESDRLQALITRTEDVFRERRLDVKIG